MPTVVSVIESKCRNLTTTRSWDFLGVPLDRTVRKPLESNIIVELLDTGIYVEAPSFKDDGFGPPPAKWKGKCDKGVNFTGCNNKVIGTRFYNLDPGLAWYVPSPADFDGHGSHTASTAAGVAVNGANLYGIVEGMARGGIPAARIAMYKACSVGGCIDADILAAFDDAIADGVDIISISIAGPTDALFEDAISLGTFHAMEKGILSVAAAGNDRPDANTVGNVAPWILTVAASNIDRQFRTPIKLGNGLQLSGVSINTHSLGENMYPLTSGPLAAGSPDPCLNATMCDIESLDPAKVKGKIVLCQEYGLASDSYIEEIGGRGVIFSVDSSVYDDTAFTTVRPVTFVDPSLGQQIMNYIDISGLSDRKWSVLFQ